MDKLMIIFLQGNKPSEHKERDAHVRMRTLFVLLVGAIL